MRVNLPKWQREFLIERLSFATLSTYLGSSFLFSILVVGIAFYWAKQSPYWSELHQLFMIEGLLFILHIVTFIITRIRTITMHLLLSMSVVFFGYKMVFDPFIFLFLMISGFDLYEQFAPLTFILIALGGLIHFALLWNEFRDLFRKQRRKRKQVNVKRRLVIFGSISIFCVVTFLIYAVKNELFHHSDVLIYQFAIIAIYYGVLIGLVDFIVGAYCFIRYPSFRRIVKKVK